jgi:hypothetical protein
LHIYLYHPCGFKRKKVRAVRFAKSTVLLPCFDAEEEHSDPFSTSTSLGRAILSLGLAILPLGLAILEFSAVMLLHGSSAPSAFWLGQGRKPQIPPEFGMTILKANTWFPA